MNIGVIIQARTSSTRLPKKVLLPLPKSNKTVLENVVDRVSKSEMINEIIVATTNDKEDDLIVNLCKANNIKYFRGDRDDVLSRYYYAAKEYNLDVVIRITSDCPLIDANLIDSIIKKHLEGDYDYTSNVIERTYPHGMDTEVFSFEVLEKVFNNATEQFEKEHVTAYINKTHKQEFNICDVVDVSDNSSIRVTLDTNDDYTLLCLVYDFLYNADRYFTNDNVVKLFNEKPYLSNINNKVVQKKVFDSLEEELEEAVKVLILQDLHRASDFVNRRLNEGINSNRR